MDLRLGVQTRHPRQQPGGAPVRVGAGLAGNAALPRKLQPGAARIRSRRAGGQLTLTSPIQTPYPENNVVRAAFFPARRDTGRAVLVLPQWNADEQSHLGLCKLLNRFGITALRMNLAYHGRRMPPELERADYHVSSNLGRTIHAGRQSVIDARACLDWLQQQGYRRLGILGTSLGSCIAFIAAAHDRRISTGVFNHVSMYFSDVILTGLSTEHIRKGLVGEVTQDQLREYWSVISPAAYLDRLRNRELKSLLIWARHDSTFLPEYSRQLLEDFGSPQVPPGVFTLPRLEENTSPLHVGSPISGVEEPAGLGAARFHLLAGVFPAGAGVFPQPPASARGLHVALRALHHWAVPPQHSRRHGDVPVLKPQLIAAYTTQPPTHGVAQENI